MTNSDNISDNRNIENKTEPISLSSALLAPVNSIFEAQIHAARAFLNFIFQMGFRHQVSSKKRKLWESDKEKYKEELNELHEQENARVEINKLNQKRKQGTELTETEINKLKNLTAEYGDLYQQSFDFIDNSGNQFAVNIPNLALLPIRPLAIHEAEFSYEFMVQNSAIKKYDQNPTIKEKEKDDKPEDSPWFLIKEPKSIQGYFAEKSENASMDSKAIKVNIKIGNTEMPYGLEKLIVHLTNSVDILNKNENNL